MSSVHSVVVGALEDKGIAVSVGSAKTSDGSLEVITPGVVTRPNPADDEHDKGLKLPLRQPASNSITTALRFSHSLQQNKAKKIEISTISYHIFDPRIFDSHVNPPEW